MTRTKDQLRESEVGDRAKRLGRRLARFAFDEGESIDELKGQLPPPFLVIGQAAIKYFNDVIAGAQAAAKAGAAPSLLVSVADVGPHLEVGTVHYCSFCGKASTN